MIFEYFSPDARELAPVSCGRRRLLFKGGSSSSSSEAVTTNQDNRIANDNGLIVTGGSTLQQDESFTLSNSDSSVRTDNTDNSFSLSNSDSSVRTDNSSRNDSFNLSNSDSSTRDSGNTTYTTTTTNITDGGAVKSAMDAATTGYSNLVGATSDMFTTVNRTDAGNYGALLGLSEKLFSQTAASQDKMSTGFTQSMLQAYDSAAASAQGGLDNRTIMILGVAGIAAVAIIAKGKL